MAKKLTNMEKRKAWKEHCRRLKRDAQEIKENNKATYEDSPNGKAEVGATSKPVRA